MSAAVLFEPGWVHEAAQASGGRDALTGEPLPPTRVQTPGTGLVQTATWTGFSETTSVGVSDERIVIFSPAIEVSAEDEFFSPSGQCWQAASDGIPRGVPRGVPEYVATRVRRAKEKDRDDRQ